MTPEAYAVIGIVVMAALLVYAVIRERRLWLEADRRRAWRELPEFRAMVEQLHATAREMGEQLAPIIRAYGVAVADALAEYRRVRRDRGAG